MTKHRLIIKGSVAFLLGIGLFAGTSQSSFAATPDSYKQTILVMKKDPSTGVVVTKQYLSSHPDNIPVLQRATIVKYLAATYVDKLHDTQSALTALDNGLAVFAKMVPNPSDASTRLSAAQAILLRSKAEILVKSAPEQVVPLLDENSTLLIKANSTSATYLYGMVRLYEDVLPAPKRPDKLVPIIQKALQLRPQVASETWLMTRFVHYLLQQNKLDQALGYAKLAWMVCPFAQRSISDTTTLLTTAWLAKTMNAGEGNAFIAAQKDSATPNPLSEIKLPAIDAQTWDTTLKSLPATDIKDRITILIMEGKMSEAMLAARQDLLAHPTTENSGAVLEMARVFKAADLNVVRANAFLLYFQTGKGTNPLDDFFKQYSTQPAATK